LTASIRIQRRGDQTRHGGPAHWFAAQLQPGYGKRRQCFGTFTNVQGIPRNVITQRNANLGWNNRYDNDDSGWHGVLTQLLKTKRNELIFELEHHRRVRDAMDRIRQPGTSFTHLLDYSDEPGCAVGSGDGVAPAIPIASSTTAFGSIVVKSRTLKTAYQAGNSWCNYQSR
jgi:hypothetical protein